MFSSNDFGEMSSTNTFIYMSTRPVKNFIEGPKNISTEGETSSGAKVLGTMAGLS
jgi:hypothetical protein